MQNTQFYKSVIDAPGCVSNGWNLVKPNYWMYFGIGVLVILSSLVLSCIPCLNILLVGPVGAVLTAGVYFLVLRDMRGEPVEFSMMFKGFETWFRYWSLVSFRLFRQWSFKRCSGRSILADWRNSYLAEPASMEIFFKATKPRLPLPEG